MIGTGRKKSIAAFIALGAGLIVVAFLLYIGGLAFDWGTGIRIFLGFLLLAVIIAGVVLNTVFLVREIRRNEQHDAFINAVTHELKTPVASIRLYAETLRTREVDEARRAHFYSIILEDSDRLLTTIEQILRTGRVGSSRRPAHMAPLELNAVIGSCVDRARSLHPNREPDAIAFQPGIHLRVLGDPEELAAAVSNLIDNALKYAGPKAKVQIELFERTGAAVIRVADNGPGIAPGELKRIFRRFYRVGGPLSTRVKGTGLGLFIVRSVARRHGGRAWAESPGPNRGSAFYIELPLHA